LKVLLERCPIATYLSVVSNYRLKNTAVVMGTMSMLLLKNYVSGLIANKVFVVRRYQQKFSFSEASFAAIICQVELPASISLHMNVITQESDSFATIADVQSRPPHEILQSGWLATLEILSCKVCQCFVSFHLDG
jgi:hypothetical protein